MPWILYVAHHTLPIICSVSDLVLTKMYFLKKDTKYVFGAAIVYMIFNYIGTKVVVSHGGKPLYPFWGMDWSNFWLSFAVYGF